MLRLKRVGSREGLMICDWVRGVVDEWRYVEWFRKV